MAELTGALSWSVLSGTAFLALLLAVVGTWPVCALLLWAYRRSINRGMRRRQSAPAPSTGRLATTSAGPVRSVAIRHAGVAARLPLLEQADRRARRARWVFAAGAVCYSIGINVVLHATQDLPWLPVQTVLLTLVFAWPALPTMVVLSRPSRRLSQVAWTAYLVVLAGLLVIGGLSALDLLTFVLLLVVLPAVFVLATGARALRGAAWLIVPVLMMLAPALLVFTSLATYLWLAAGTPELDWSALLVMTGAGFALLLVVVAYVWGVVRAHLSKWASDQTLLLLQWWFVSALWTAMLLGARSSRVAVLSLAPFGFLLLILLAAAASRRPDDGAPVRLLLLRTFGSRGRSTRLLRDLTAQWRWIGSVELIVAPDVASETLEPDTFLHFISGRLPARFVQDPPSLQRKLDSLDLSPDRDGRYRVNEFLCHDDTWQPAVEALAASTHAVLLDLRGFTGSNAGVRFELERLVALVPLTRVVAVVDTTTDMRALDAALAHAAASTPSTSPLLDDPAPALQVVSFQSGGPQDAQRLLGAVASAAGSGRAHPQS